MSKGNNGGGQKFLFDSAREEKIFFLYRSEFLAETSVIKERLTREK